MSDRRYEKPAPIEVDEAVESLEFEPKDITLEEVLEPIPATPYSKAEGIVTPEVFVVVFSNGEVREKNYFKWMMKNCARLKLEFFAVPISPDDLLDEVKKKKAEYMLTATDGTPDTYYTVTDVDHFYNDIVRSIPEYKKEEIKLIVSNPCFEVWLYYSKRADKFEGFIMPEERLKFSQSVKTFVNDKILGGCNPKKAVFDIEQNIVNARANYGEDEHGLPVQFATNMFILAESVLPYIQKEILAVLHKEIPKDKG